MEFFRIKLLAGIMAMSCGVMEEAAAAVTETTDGENIVACEPYLQNPVGG